MDSDELKKRTKKFALDIIDLVKSIPRNRPWDVLSNQLVRSATSVGANYRAACRARSRADFISKITVVEEESDESLYWLEILEESHGVADFDLRQLKEEASQLTAIFTASGKTAKTRNSQSPIRPPKLP